MNANASLTVVMERELPHQPEKVWRALTESALLEDWLMKNDFEPVVGRKFTFRAQPMPQWNGVVDCEVLAIEPCKRLAYAWGVGDDPATGFRTIVTWTLTPTQSGVILRMEQSGFRADQEANRRGAEFGWRRFLDGLARVLEGIR